MTNLVSAQTLQTPPPPLFIFPSNQSQTAMVPEKEIFQKSHGSLHITHSERPTDHSADPFMNVEDINRIVEYALNRKAYGKAALFVFGINTGYRCGDALGFRVCDFYDKQGIFADILYISEDKTGKVRPVYINKAVKTAIELAIKEKNLSDNNYVFRTDGNKRSYLLDFKRNSNGDIEDAVTTFERYDENGNEREVAPYSISAIIRWLKSTAKELGIYGHYSSHAMRKTFIEHISRNFEDNRNPLIASVSVAHSSVKTTVEYYMSVDPIRLREKWLGLNLGLEAIEDYIKSISMNELIHF